MSVCHDLSKKEILGIDTTGSVVRKINNFKKNFPVYNYDKKYKKYSYINIFLVKLFLCLGLCISLVESVRYFIMCLREKERSLFSSKVQTHMVIENNSKVLQITLLLEYSAETIDQYCQHCDRMYKVITRKQEATNTQKTFIQVCSNHLLAQMKRTPIWLKISEKHFVVRILGILIECKNLSELTFLFIAFCKVTMAEYTFEYTNAVNEFKKLYVTIDNITNVIEDKKLDEECF